MAMMRCMYLLVVVAAVGYGAPNVSAQSSTRLELVEQFIADRNSLSTSLRRLHLGLGHPTGFQDVFHVPGEPGKLMRVHGGIHAVFSQSLYAYNDDDEVEAVIPPNTVFRIGPRVVHDGAALSPMDGHPGVVMARDQGEGGEANPHRIVAEGFGRGAELPQARQRSVTTSREATPTIATILKRDEAEPVNMVAPGTIIGDEHYRRERLRELMRRAADAE